MDKERFDVLCRALKKLELDSYEKISYLPVFHGLPLEDFQDKDRFFERVKDLDFLLFTQYIPIEDGDLESEEEDFKTGEEYNPESAETNDLESVKAIPGGIVFIDDSKSNILGFYVLPECQSSFLMDAFFGLMLNQMDPSTIWLTGVQSQWFSQCLCEFNFRRVQTDPFDIWKKVEWWQPSLN